MRIYVRTARPSDRDAVFRFTEHTWEWGDYIPTVWERWITEPKSRLLVATANRVPVGISHAVMVSPNEGWIEGLRVDPAYRRQRIGLTLTRQSVAEAQIMGARVVRFITSSLNTPVHEIAGSLGFNRTAVIQPLEATASAGQISQTVVPTKEESDALISFIENSAAYKAASGLYSTGWRFLALTPDEVAKKMAEGMVRTIRKDGTIAAAAIVERAQYRDSLGVSYAGGDAGPLETLAKALRNEAAAMGLESVHTRLPDTPETDRPFIAAGYEKSDENPFWIFAKSPGDQDTGETPVHRV